MRSAIDTTDIIVLGGGPGGLASALVLARQGLKVRLFEKREFPVDKACGEGIMPTGLAILKKLGVSVQGQPFTGINYSNTTSKLHAGADFREGPGLASRRLELSSALYEACQREKGIELFASCPARLLDSSPEGTVIEGGGALHKARLVVAADGLHSHARRWAGLQGRRARARRWGLRQHFRIAPWSRRVEVVVHRDCELYLCPVGADEVGVSVIVTDPGAGFCLDAVLRNFPEIHDRLRPAARASKERGLGPLEQRVRRFHVPGLVLLGDACGYVDACTGEGISLALAQAEALGEIAPPLFHQQPGRITLPQELSLAYRKLLWPHEFITYANLFINSHVELQERMLRGLGGRPELLQSLFSVSMGTLDPFRFLLRNGVSLLRALL